MISRTLRGDDHLRGDLGGKTRPVIFAMGIAREACSRNAKLGELRRAETSTSQRERLRAAGGAGSAGACLMAAAGGVRVAE